MLLGRALTLANDSCVSELSLLWAGWVVTQAPVCGARAGLCRQQLTVSASFPAPAPVPLTIAWAQLGSGSGQHLWQLM